jgi:hypothetical protein
MAESVAWTSANKMWAEDPDGNAEKNCCALAKDMVAATRLRRHQCATCIQRWWRESVHFDPISLERVSVPFRVYRGKVAIVYNAPTLHAYICTTGDLLDPVCRTKFSAAELRRLDVVVGGERQLHRQIHSLEAQQGASAMRIDLCDAIERDMRAHVHALAELPDLEAFGVLHDTHAFVLLQCFANLFAVDASRCRLSLAAMRVTIDATLNPESLLYGCLMHMFVSFTAQCEQPALMAPPPEIAHGF